MQRKVPTDAKLQLTVSPEDQTFLETSEADLVIRWRKQIRAGVRKERLRAEKVITVDVKE